MESRVPFAAKAAAVVIFSVILGGVIGLWPAIAPAGSPSDWLTSVGPTFSSLYNRVR